MAFRSADYSFDYSKNFWNTLVHRKVFTDLFLADYFFGYRLLTYMFCRLER